MLDKYTLSHTQIRLCKTQPRGRESQTVKPMNIFCKMCTGDKDWGEEEEGRRTREEMRGKQRKGGEGRRKKGRRGKEEEREEEREEEEEGGTLCKKGYIQVCNLL